MTNLDSILKSRDITLPTKVRLVKANGFSSGHVWMWELDCEESWAPKNWCFWTVVSEKTLESPLDCKEIQPVHSEGDQPWDFFGRNDAKAETPVLLPPHAKSWLIGKDSDAGRDWGQEEKGTTEDEMAGWYHWLDGRESEWTLGVGEGQGGLACCDSWGHKESDTTEQLNWTEQHGDAFIQVKTLHTILDVFYYCLCYTRCVMFSQRLHQQIPSPLSSNFCLLYYHHSGPSHPIFSPGPWHQPLAGLQGAPTVSDPQNIYHGLKT